MGLMSKVDSQQQHWVKLTQHLEIMAVAASAGIKVEQALMVQEELHGEQSETRVQAR